MSTNISKKDFAKLVIKHKGNYFNAALEHCGEEQVSAALKLYNEYINDTDLEAEIEKIKRVNAESELPDRLDLLNKLWAIANDPYTKPEDSVKALKLYAEVKGYAGKNENANTVSIPSVLVIKDHGTNDDWETKALTQQRALTGMRGN